MDMPDMPEPTTGAFLPLEQFFQDEVAIFRETQELIYTDVQQLLDAARGILPASPEIQGLLGEVSQQRVPLVWQTQGYPSCVPLVRYVGLCTYQPIPNIFP